MSELTRLENLIDPEVIGDMVQAKLEEKVSIIPYAKLDRTLQGNAGSTITVARFVWDGIADKVAEGEDIPLRQLGTESAEYEIQMAGIGATITDKAVLSANGNPIGACVSGIANSIQGALDVDAYTELLKSTNIYDAKESASYENIVDAIGLFRAEGIIDMVALCDPDVITTLRKDPNFIDKNKYGNSVVMNGEIGMVGNARIVATRRAKGVGGYFYTPIVLTADPEHNDDIPALTYFIKRDTNIEVERKARNRTTEITADQFYVVALTNESKVVILKTTGATVLMSKMPVQTYVYPDTDVRLSTTNITGAVSLDRSNDPAWIATLKLSGAANAITSAQATALGFDASCTHYITGCLEIPGAGLSDVAPTDVLWNGGTVSKKEMRKIGASWYVDFVMGVKKVDGNVVLASGATTFTLKAGDITTTYTPNFTNVTLN